MQNQLFVGNLAFSTTEDELRAAFSVYGSVAEVKIPVDRETKRVRGFAFVTFENQDAAEKALALDGTDLNGRPIRVNVAQEKKSGGHGGAGGGGRSGGRSGGGFNKGGRGGSDHREGGWW